MIHTEVYSRFKKELPTYAKAVVEWWPNGYNSIRVRLNTDEQFIFSIMDNNEFIFEDMDCFLVRLKGGSAMRC